MKMIRFTALFGAEQPFGLISRYPRRCCNCYKGDKEKSYTILFLRQDQ